jgi:hypothetical protein
MTSKTVRGLTLDFVISDFLHGVNEILALLGCYTAWIASYRRFGTIYKFFFLDS